jgi:RHS repeat-associated protein
MPRYNYNRFAHPVIILVRRLLPAEITGRQASIDYDGSRNLVGVEPPANGDRYCFTSREFDHVKSLQYQRDRFYDPTPGRWLSEDALGFFAGDDHRYPYPRPSGPDANP